MAESRESDMDLELWVGGKELKAKVLKPMRNAFVELNSDAKFTCKVRCLKYPIITWCKDGKMLKRSDRISLSYNNKTYQLKINNVTYSDYGLYTFLCADGLSQLQSRAGLYIKPEKNHGVLYRSPVEFEKIAVDRHTINNLIEKGKSVGLEIQLQNEVDCEFLWYKDNSPVVSDESIIIQHNGKCSSLCIPEAIETDSGLYYVMVRSERGLISSFASVVVMPKIEINDPLPIFEELLPEEVECNKNENVEVMCKVQMDPHTLPPIWNKNETEIFDSDKFTKQDYGCGFIGLKLINAALEDTAEYSVTVRNGLTDKIDSSKFLLSVDEPADITWPTPELLTPLDTAIACFGAEIIMNCTFDIKNSKYFYAVWQVGRYRAECSNHRFIVEFNDGDCILIIKCVEPEMAGSINCELRRALPNRKSVYMLNSTANIVLVPPAYFEEELKRHPPNQKLFKSIQKKPAPKTAGQSSTMASCSKTSRMETPLCSNVPDDLISPCQENVRLPNDPLEIAFCRPDEDNHTFLKVIKSSIDIDGDSLYFYDKNVRPNKSLYKEDHLQKVIIRWDPLKMETWFLIEFVQPDNSYREVGVTSKPQFEIWDAPTEKILRYRITAIHPREDCYESAVAISPPHEDMTNKQSICELKSMREFTAKYTRTGDKIGSGAFGTVSLVKNHRDELFAAKTIKTRSNKKRDAAMREFELMRGLKHPKIIELNDAFMSRDSFILVMDYLWGGNLLERIVEDEDVREIDVIQYVKQICEALKYLHAQNIVHLDVKPENIMCQNPNSRQIKLIDFGLARLLNKNRFTKFLYGTKDYAAPEVLCYDRLTTSCDMWSLGILTFLLLSGIMPFTGESWLERSVSITKVNFNYLDPAFDDISDMAKNFIDNLLILNPDIRMDAKMALNHMWIDQGPSNVEKTGQMHLTRQNLKSYLEKHRALWQRAGNVMIAAQRLRNKVAQKSGTDSEKTTSKVT